MKQCIDIDTAIRLHTHWRRQFLNAFAGGDYADMPLSEHRACMLAEILAADDAVPADSRELPAVHRRFHDLANEIIELSNNGMGHAADLLLPELNEASHQLVALLDKLRATRNEKSAGQI